MHYSFVKRGSDKECGYLQTMISTNIFTDAKFSELRLVNTLPLSKDRSLEVSGRSMEVNGRENGKIMQRVHREEEDEGGQDWGKYSALQ